jgi:hypothetical protein
MRPILIALVLGLAACSNAPSQPESNIVGTPMPGSKFTRVQIGMSKGQVEDIIGKPTDEDNHMTAKVAIPFYFGGDTTEIDAHYKYEGVLTYGEKSFGSTTYMLRKIVVNPADTGYIH